ncbi:MAG: sulfotransferase, partial [Methylococcales bacterium]
MNIDTEKLLDEAYLLVHSLMYEPAIAKYNYILEHNKNCDEALFMRGTIKGKLGRIDAAVTDIERSIKINNKNDAAFLTLAGLHERKSDTGKAIDLCRNSIALNNNNNEARNLLVKLCLKLGNDMLSGSMFDKAETWFRIALDYKNDAAVSYRLVLALRGQGKIEASIRQAEKVIDIDPNHIRANAHIASSYELLGEIEKGMPLIEDLFQEHPEHPMVSIVYAHYALHNKKQKDGILALSNMLRGNNIQEYDAITAIMFLGKLYDSLGEYDAAFKYYKQANEILDKNYDPFSFENHVTDLIDYFSKEKYLSIAESENTSNELIFIVGMPRSGTSLVEQIISTHSGVFGAGELVYVNNLIDALQAQLHLEKAYPVCLDDIDTTMMNILAEKLISDIRTENADSIKISDKLPHNFLHIGLIHKLLPNAKIINCVRDARDTCLSCYFQYFAGHHPYANNLRSLGMHYFDYKRLMKHWTDKLDIPVLTVSYEKVVSDKRNEIKRIIDFLDLPWEEECLDFYKHKRTVATASYNQVNKDIYTGSVGRWKNYETY